MQLTFEQKRAFHTDAMCRSVEIKEHLIKTDQCGALLKHAPFKTLSASERYSAADFAAAYVKSIEAGELKPIKFDEDYNTKVMRKYHEAEVRRLQCDSVVMDGIKPFKTKSCAETYQKKYSLEITHYVKAVDHGFVLYQNSLSKQQELTDQAKGYKTYEQLRSQAFQELGLKEAENEDGELIASDEQWAVIDARVHELQQTQRGVN